MNLALNKRLVSEGEVAALLKSHYKFYTYNNFYITWNVFHRRIYIYTKEEIEETDE